MIRLGTEVLEEMKDFSWIVFFDLFLAIAIKYFGENHPDYVILETGIGGRYDSTNFIPDPIVSVITSISLDHQALLGDTLEKIAWQKAGIIKSDCPIFTVDSQKKSVLEVFAQEASQLGATLQVVRVNRYCSYYFVALYLPLYVLLVVITSLEYLHTYHTTLKSKIFASQLRC